MVSHHAHPAADLVAALQAQLAAAALMVLRPALPEGRPRFRPPMSCVEAVKAALHINAPSVLTPWQLACHLRRRCGALVVVTRSKET